ncbi:hypothetical protein GCM10017635_27920 [Paracoccus kondratievae]|uniref:Uncharacterized protein n=1 Tax=Paracoccus kondratievae TaxID=135740 RepID=A0AAD3P0R6_9RHOB|nr:hypothetical protein GCM10017635_27920 [Paracoccus kondratievae]
MGWKGKRGFAGHRLHKRSEAKCGRWAKAPFGEEKGEAPVPAMQGVRANARLSLKAGCTKDRDRNGGDPATGFRGAAAQPLRSRARPEGDAR